MTSNFLTPKQFSELHPAFPIGGIRHIIFHSETNGFSKSIKRLGRKVLIDEDLFFVCLNEKNGGANE
tara:strand:- start:3602 stop:3802 length:201 start_codon:yes stop_codon:yes gene_type:complete